MRAAAEEIFHKLLSHNKAAALEVLNELPAGMLKKRLSKTV